MKEKFIEILREANENRTVYTPNIINETPSQTTNSIETKYQQEQIDNISTGIAVPINTTKEKEQLSPSNEIIPNKKINQIIDISPVSNINCQDILATWQALFPTIPGGVNLLPNYTPQNLSQKKYDVNFTNLSDRQIAKLIREIYLRILRSLDTYSLLIKKESGNNQRSLVLLRTQMQVLSSAVLNVYQDYTAFNVVPLRVDINSFIPKNLKQAYLYLYNEIYCIYYLLTKLIFSLTNTNFNGQLVTILSNIKYQLNIIFTLYNSIN